MNLVKETHGGFVPLGLKRWPFKLIKHFADTTRVSPSPAGPVGCCHLNVLNMINMKFRVGLGMGAAYSSLAWTKVLHATSLVLLGAKAKFLRRNPSVLVTLEEISET